MNSKKILILTLCAAVVAGAWWYLDTRNTAGGSMLPVDQRPNAGPSTDDGGEQRTVRGTITEIDTDGIMLDGPYVINIAAENGARTRIEIPSMGINLCPAQDAIAGIDTLAVGQTIEVRGYASGSALVPCERADHYLRVIE